MTLYYLQKSGFHTEDPRMYVLCLFVCQFCGVDTIMKWTLLPFDLMRSNVHYLIEHLRISVYDPTTREAHRCSSTWLYSVFHTLYSTIVNTVLTAITEL